MSVSMRYLFVVAVLAGAFETLSAVWLNAPDRAGQLSAGAFGVVLLACAWGLVARRSVVAASVIGVLLVVDVVSIPLFDRSSWQDWVVQGVFGAVGLVGIAAWVDVLRARRAARAAVDH